MNIWTENENIPKDKSLATPNHHIPKQLYLFPLTERPFFPPQTKPVLVDVNRNIESTIKSIYATPLKMAGLVMVDETDINKIKAKHFHSIGSICKIYHPLKIGDKIQFIAEGIKRFRIMHWISDVFPFQAEIEDLSDNLYDYNTIEIKAYAWSIISILKSLIPLNPLYSEELKYFLNRYSTTNPAALCDFAASLTSADKNELQDILATLNLTKRMEKVNNLLRKEEDVIKFKIQIKQQVEETINAQQREFFLKEQLKTIQQELGIAKDDKTADVELFNERMNVLQLTEQAKERVDAELEKIQILELGSPEYAVTRNYVDIITSLPWGIVTKDKLNIKHARRILNKDHEGLHDIKERILEFIAVANLKKEITGSIILLVGPPGVGKTSIGRSIANALNRKFYRFSVGGMRDEAEIKGHRRTYISAMPGKFIQALLEVKSSNPVLMIDEIDKIQSSYHGDPASALLEVLDPEQNSSFLDHYLDIRFDLSKIIFICTANQLDTIPQPLLDRMEVLRLAGYITAEKFSIAKKHLWPRLLHNSGIKNSQLKLSSSALQAIIEGYARDAGVRALDKQLDKIVRKVAMQLVDHPAKKISIIKNNLVDYLGLPIFQDEKKITGIGIATGLAWTAMGGATLAIETKRIHTYKRGYSLTGMLGKVMRESAAIALNYVIANLENLGGDPNFYDNAFVHIHVPEGATPKDGPSAGITIAAALLSLARNEHIVNNIAMTGELTLSGHILAVGGIREKIVAAQRSKINRIILPTSVEKDYYELPGYLKHNLKVTFVDHFEDAIPLLFPCK